MADSTITNLPPIPPTPPSQQVVPSSQPVALPPGSVISGFIVNRDALGNPILRTAAGDIPFSTSFFLPIGSEVTLRVGNLQTGAPGQLLTVDGQPPEVAAAQSAFATTPDVILSNSIATDPNSVLPTATDVTPADIVSTLSPTDAQPLGATAAPVVNLNGTLISLPQNSNANALIPGTQIALQVTSFTPPPATPSQPLAAPPAPPSTSVSEPLTPNALTPTVAATAATSYATYAQAATPVPTTATATPLAVPLQGAGTAAFTGQPFTTQPPPIATVATQVAEVTPEPETETVPAVVPTVASTAIDLENNHIPQTIPTAPTAQLAALNPASVQLYPLSNGQTVSATVIGNEPSGETLLQTPFGIVRLPADSNLPTGSAVTLTIGDIAPPEDAPATVAAANQPASLTELAQHWGSLQQIVTLLTQRAEASGESFVPPSIPMLLPPTLQAPTAAATAQPQSIPAGVMLFIAALKGGDFRGWLGATNAQWLESQGHDALLRKADGEFSTLARQFTQAPSQQWQTLFFPIAVGGDIQQARLFVKRDRRSAGSRHDSKGNDTRFVLEVDLTQLGEMQMDGFVRKNITSVQFDMVIRSLHPLPEEVQKDILRIYTDTGQLTGYTGSLAFQNVKEFPVNPMDEIIAHHQGSWMA